MVWVKYNPQCKFSLNWIISTFWLIESVSHYKLSWTWNLWHARSIIQPLRRDLMSYFLLTPSDKKVSMFQFNSQCQCPGESPTATVQIVPAGTSLFPDSKWLFLMLEWSHLQPHTQLVEILDLSLGIVSHFIRHWMSSRGTHRVDHRFTSWDTNRWRALSLPQGDGIDSLRLPDHLWHHRLPATWHGWAAGPSHNCRWKGNCSHVGTWVRCP